MPTPSVGKVIQYTPSVPGALGPVIPGIIAQMNPFTIVLLDGTNVTLTGIPQDDTQTTPNSWTFASQTS